MMNNYYLLCPSILGLVHEGGKTFGVYAVSITRVYMSGKEENWHVYKRYSDFYDLYQRVKDRVNLFIKQYLPNNCLKNQN